MYKRIPVKDTNRNLMLFKGDTLAVSSSEVWVFEKTEKGYYLFTVAEDEEEE